MLSAYRVLDLTDERGQIAGSILAQLGAEVIAVEPPDGTRSRALAPFYEDEPGVERSVHHWAYNRGKKSVVLDLEDPAQPEQLLALLAGADVLIECYEPAERAERGLTPGELAAINPALVHVSVTPYGYSGPKARWEATDLTTVAASCTLAITGDLDRAPVRISQPQGFLHAGADAAVAALVALAERRRSGLGQHVDVSAQTSAMAGCQGYVLAAPVNAPPLVRYGGGTNMSGIDIQLVWECADGYISQMFAFGASLGPFARRLWDWMYDEGACTDADRRIDWVDFGMQLHNGEASVDEWERLKSVAAAFFRTKTKAEIMAAAVERKLLSAPAMAMDELASFEQLAARAYWHDVHHPAIDRTVRHPGFFARFSASQPEPVGAPPILGAHTAEVLDAEPRQPAVTSTTSGAINIDRYAAPLDGLKVLDLMWAVAGPSSTRILADYGATVVRVESIHGSDAPRTFGPFLDDEPGPDNTALYQTLNAGKLGLALDLGRPESREVALDLVRWADVVTESFAPGVVDRWGLSYDEVRVRNPSVIMLSSSIMGQDGPLATMAGVGTMAAALGGFHEITGWPDRAPAGPYSAYTDFVAPRFTVAALLAALEHRERTGEGQHIDLSQLEASLHFLAPAILDYSVNGRVARRVGNDDPTMAPHGVYRSAGEDQWIAIACADKSRWHALCVLIDRADLAQREDLHDLAGRLQAREEIDEAIEAWTRERPARVAEEQLQAAGVASYEAQNSQACCDDPQIMHLRHIIDVDHPIHGTFPIENSRFRLSRTPALITSGAPTIGQHVHEVLHGLLGYDDDHIAELAALGLFE